MCTNTYLNSERFDKVIAETKWCSLFCTKVYMYTYRVFIQRKRTKRAIEQKSHNVPRFQLQAIPNKCVFTFRLETGLRLGHRRSASSSFHNRNRRLWPNRLCVCRTDSIPMPLAPEHSGQRPMTDSRRQSPVRYTGATPDSDWWTSPAILKMICWRTGGQRSYRSTGVMLYKCKKLPFYNNV